MDWLVADPMFQNRFKVDVSVSGVLPRENFPGIESSHGFLKINGSLLVKRKEEGCSRQKE